MYKDVYKVACTYKLPARLPVQQNNLLPNTLVVCQKKIYGIHRSTLFTCYHKCDEFTDRGLPGLTRGQIFPWKLVFTGM